MYSSTGQVWYEAIAHCELARVPANYFRNAGFPQCGSRGCVLKYWYRARLAQSKLVIGWLVKAFSNCSLPNRNAKMGQFTFLAWE